MGFSLKIALKFSANKIHTRVGRHFMANRQSGSFVGWFLDESFGGGYCQNFRRENVFLLPTSPRQGGQLQYLLTGING